MSDDSRKATLQAVSQASEGQGSCLGVSDRPVSPRCDHALIVPTKPGDFLLYHCRDNCKHLSCFFLRLYYISMMNSYFVFKLLLPRRVTTRGKTYI